MSWYVLPLIAIGAAIFGFVWIWIGANAAMHEGGPVAYLLIVFGFGGIVLGLALWNTWRSMTSRKVENR